MKKLTINGELRETDEATIAALLQSINIHERMVVVEYNGEIVPREEYGKQELADGDRLEIVQMMAGG